VSRCPAYLLGYPLQNSGTCGPSSPRSLPTNGLVFSRGDSPVPGIYLARGSERSFQIWYSGTLIRFRLEFFIDVKRNPRPICFAAQATLFPRPSALRRHMLEYANLSQLESSPVQLDSDSSHWTRSTVVLISLLREGGSCAARDQRYRKSSCFSPHAVLKIIPSFSPPNASRTRKINVSLRRRSCALGALQGADSFETLRSLRFRAGHVEVRSFSFFIRSVVGSEQACLRAGKPVILGMPCEARECHVMLRRRLVPNLGLSRQLCADPGPRDLTTSPPAGNACCICFSNVILFQFLFSVLWV
jgi:hypothetical protein